jgi:hypothetical protein
VPTEKEIDAAALALYHVEHAPMYAKGMMPATAYESPEIKGYWRKSAEAALVAAETVRGR